MCILKIFPIISMDPWRMFSSFLPGHPRAKVGLEAIGVTPRGPKGTGEWVIFSFGKSKDDHPKNIGGYIYIYIWNIYGIYMEYV